MGRAALFGGILGGSIAVGLIAYALRPHAPRRAPAVAPRVPRLPHLTAPIPRPVAGPVAAPSASSSAFKVPTPQLAAWLPYLATGATSRGIQLPYVIKWLSLESGGNPCAVGYPAAHGPDGMPREMGIAMLYNPDDLKALGVTSQELRAYCVAGDQHDRVWKGKHIKGFSGELARPLTAAEMQQQADATIGLIVRSMNSATKDLTAAGAGPSWSKDRRDYWALVKLQHALPALSREGMPAVTAYLGRAPATWSEFRSTLDNVKLSDRVEAKYRADFKRLLDNAEKCSSAFVEKSLA